MLLKLIVYCRLLLLQNVFPCLVHGAPVSVAWEDGKDPEFESSAAASVMPSWKDILWLPDDASSNRFQAPGSATGRMFSNNYWNQSGNCVPYAIAPDFDAEAQHLIRTALLAIENATHGCVRFIKREHEKEFISIQHKPGCAADVGRTPRRITKVILGGNCLSPRTIIHEIFHALGFYHEHSRPDRDTYVTVNAAPSNIERNVDLRNFNILPDMPVFNLPYDYDSIMHYAPSDFAANPNDPNGAVIMPKVNGSLKIGKRDQLSVLDIARLKVAYGCLDANLGPIRKTFPNNCKMTVKVAERVEEPVVSAVRHQHSPTSRKPKGSRLRELNEVPRYVEDNNAESPFLPEFSDKLMTNEQCAAQFTSNCSPVQRKKAACARFRGLEIHCYNTATLEEIAQITAAVSRPPIRAVRIRLNDGPLITYRNFVRVSTQVVQFTLSFCRGARASGKLAKLCFVRLLDFELSWCDNLEIHKDDFKESLQLRIILLAQSTIRTLEEGTFTNLRSLEVLSLEYGLESLLHLRPRYRDHVARIHCECEFAWLRTWLNRNAKLLWKKDAGAVYKLQKSYSNPAYKRRDLYIPVDCSNLFRSNASLVSFAQMDFSISDSNCVVS